LKLASFTFALFWWVQAILCCAPGAGLAHAMEGHADHAQATGQAPHHPADPGQPADPNDACAQHCASQRQVLGGTPAAVPTPAPVALAIPPALPEVQVGSTPSEWVQRALAHPPPDLLVLNRTLRI